MVSTKEHDKSRQLNFVSKGSNTYFPFHLLTLMVLSQQIKKSEIYQSSTNLSIVYEFTMDGP